MFHHKILQAILAHSQEAENVLEVWTWAHGLQCSPLYYLLPQTIQNFLGDI